MDPQDLIFTDDDWHEVLEVFENAEAEFGLTDRHRALAARIAAALGELDRHRSWVFRPPVDPDTALGRVMVRWQATIDARYPDRR